MGEAPLQLADGAEIFEEAFLAGLRPEPVLTVTEWANRYRWLAQRASSAPGKFRSDVTPYTTEIMDALSALSPVQKVVFMASAQVGKTETGNNWIGYVIDQSPSPILVVWPTIPMAQKNSKLRIDTLIAECPRLREKVSNPRARDSGNTRLQKEFPGGILSMTGANSASGLKSMPAERLFLDEVDEFPGDVDGQGDPVALAEARLRTFPRRKIYLCSTPTVEGRSRIAREFAKTDQRYYFVPCPECGHMQRLVWRASSASGRGATHAVGITWQKDKRGRPDLSTVGYGCESCGVLIREHSKPKMLSRGEWRPMNPEHDDPKVRGYHINALYAPLGWFSWADCVQTFVEARNNPVDLKAFVNTVLGETWKDTGDAPDWKALYRRRESYQVGKVPKGGIFLTAGVDVQKDRLEAQVVAWGRERHCWTVDYRVIPGKVEEDEVWEQLDELLAETWPHELGTELPLEKLAVDTGYATSRVYAWAARHSLSQVMAVKGQDKLGVLVGQPRFAEVNRHGRRVKRGARYWPLGVEIAKNELYGRLRLEAGIEEGQDVLPAGWFHFPELDEEFFRQLTAEQIVIEKRRGFPKPVWEKIRERNEVLDTWVYARAAAAAVGVDRLKEADWERREHALVPDPRPPRERPKRGGERRPRERKKRKRKGYLDGGEWR